MPFTGTGSLLTTSGSLTEMSLPESPSFLQMPIDIHFMIVRYLKYNDILNLRHTSSNILHEIIPYGRLLRFRNYFADLELDLERSQGEKSSYALDCGTNTSLSRYMGTDGPLMLLYLSTAKGNISIYLYYAHRSLRATRF